MSKLPSGWLPEKSFEEIITNMQVDVLSARCAADRLRLKTDVGRIAIATTPESLDEMIASLRVLLDFAVAVQKTKIAMDNQSTKTPGSRDRQLPRS